jgi:threonine synthase
MLYRSTRGGGEPVSIRDAIRTGQAEDGGLFLPESLPEIDFSSWPAGLSLGDAAAAFLAPFFKGDELEADLPEIARDAFDIDVPAVAVDPARPTLFCLELFHGPTGAFKDFGARFLMRCLNRLGDPDNPYTVLAATSGDTGGAVGCAAEGASGVRAVILFPEGRVSAFQRHQLMCWTSPVDALEVQGDFDACQSLVKQAFSDPELKARHRLTSANSINIARLLPQAAYWAWAAHRSFVEQGSKPNLIIPTGNLGHGVAAMIARACGAPIGEIDLVTNANMALSEWAESGEYAPRPSIATIANAMDVGAPNNFERLMHLFGDAPRPHVERVDDDAIRVRMKSDYETSGYVWCPHSATGAEAFARMNKEDQSSANWLVAGTAHPYKFADIVEPVIGRTVSPSSALADVLERPAHARSCPPTLAALEAALDDIIKANAA